VKGKFFLIILFFVFFFFLFQIYETNMETNNCRSMDLNVLTINSFDIIPDNPKVRYIGFSFADMTVTKLSTIEGLHFIERPQLEKVKRKLGIRENELITKELATRLGHMLKVDIVILGDIETGKEHFRVGAQILDLRKKENDISDLFISEPVEGSLENIEKNIEPINKIQREIAVTITKAIPVALTHKEEISVNKDFTKSGNAYVAYAKGRYLYFKYISKENDEAIEKFKYAIDIDPNFALAYAALAQAYTQKAGYFKTGDRILLQEAIQKSEKAIELDPFLIEGYVARGASYTYEGLFAYYSGAEEEAWELWKKAIDDYKRVLDVQPHYINVSLNLSKIYIFRNQLDKASEYLDSLCDRYYYEPAARFFRGHLYTLQGKLDEAIHEFKEVLKLTDYMNPFERDKESPLIIESYINIAMCYGEKNKYDKAMENIEEAKKINPDYPLIHYALGRIYAKDMEYEKAKEECEIYLKLNPEGNLAKEVKRLLEKLQEKLKDNDK